jgi:hypothetical protein
VFHGARCTRWRRARQPQPATRVVGATATGLVSTITEPPLETRTGARCTVHDAAGASTGNGNEGATRVAP